MSTQRSLSELISRATSTLVAKTGQTNPAIDAIACAIAGVSYGQYGYQDQLFRELNPETCSEEWLYLHASRHNTARLLPTFARGNVQVEQLGGIVTIPKGVRLTDASGQIFQTLSAQYSNEAITVMALTAGIKGNLPKGAMLKLTTAISGVSPDAIECLGFSGGADIEELEHWRQRVIIAFNNNQLVGRARDYEVWAQSAHADVDYAWALDNTPQLGMVEVYIGARENDPTLSDAVINAVQAMFEEKRLAGCHPSALIPTHKPFDVEIQGIEDEAIRSSVIVALQTFVQSKMGVIDSTTKTPTSITPTELVLAISKVTSNFIVKSPIDAQVAAANEVHVLREVIWTPPN